MRDACSKTQREKLIGAVSVWMAKKGPSDGFNWFNEVISSMDLLLAPVTVEHVAALTTNGGQGGIKEAVFEASKTSWDNLLPLEMFVL